MKLPNLDDLETKMNSSIREEPKNTKVAKKKQAKETIKEVKVKEKKKPIIPKSQYDAEGNPLLSIPDLDDVDLTNEINRFFGEEED